MARIPRVALALWGMLAVAVAPVDAPAAEGPPEVALLAKAPADECYGGVGATYVAKDAAGCPSGRRPKVNQAYLWGLTKAGDDLWFGTAPNTLCLVLGEIVGRLGSEAPLETDAWACELGSSGFRAALPDPAALEPRLGDWRPPKLYRYRMASQRLEDVGRLLTGEDLARLHATLGIRSAGAIGRTVLLAGPALGAGGIGRAQAVNVFAFDATSGAFIASATLPQVSDVRRWIVVGDELYTAVGKPSGGGAVLRWNGDPDAPGTPETPSPSLFDFEEVGSLPAEGADLTEHRGRIYVTTWPVVEEGAVAAGVYRTPSLGRDGWLPASPAPLEEIWTADDYEPDPVTAKTYLGGAIASYDGRLVWGTMHAPFVGAVAHVRRHREQYGERLSAQDVLSAVGGTHRPTALFSAERLDEPNPRIRLLYGSEELPAYEPGAGWRLVPNRAHAAPELGEAGFDNPFNAYTWSLQATRRGLYVGTMDWSYLLGTAVSGLLTGIAGVPVPKSELPTGRFGADLLELRSLRRPALAISRTGLGNEANYGIRTMVADRQRLYVGTANPMNLLPRGGWELLELGPGVMVQRRR